MLDRLREDVAIIFEKDPAVRSTFEALTCYPGLRAIWMYRIAHWLWLHNFYYLARLISHLTRRRTGIEIHPGAKIGRRVFIDHGMGCVIGETAEVGDDVLMYKGVVLGGTSLEKGKRHPTIGKGVILGSNAIVLGPILVDDYARIGSGAVVVKPIPRDSTAVGVPARVVRGPHLEHTLEETMDHGKLPDPICDTCQRLVSRVDELEARLFEMSHLLEQAEALALRPKSA